MSISARFKVIFICLLIGLTPNTYADDVETALGELWQTLPVQGELMRHPGAKAWNVYGLRNAPRLVKSDGAHNGKALKVNIKKASANIYSVGAQAKSQVSIKSGDMIFASVWLRAQTLPAGQNQAKLPLLLQQASEPYGSFSSASANVGTDWQAYFIHGRADQDYNKGGMNVSIHLSGAAQTIELGSVFMLNMGSGDIDMSKFPVSGTPAPLHTTSNLVTTPIAAKAIPEFLRADLSALQNKLPNAGTVMSNPAVENWQARGDNQSNEIVSAYNVPGGKAMRIEAKKAGINPWDTGAATPVTGPIAEGDTVLLAFYARAVDVHNEAQTGIISSGQIELNRDPYTSIQTGAAKLPKTWDMYYIGGKAHRSYAPGEAQVSLHLGAVRQTLELGPVYVINLGQNVDPRNLPRNEITYEGRDTNAPWRTAAKARIEQHRKGDLSLSVVDAQGQAIHGAQITAEQTKHAYLFGSFTNYNIGTSRAKKFPKVGETFSDMFNSATLPLYWADWGWQNTEHKRDYKAGVKYFAERDIPWRGHPVMWPGEKQMPSYLLAMKPGSNKQRKAVMSHVREVMSFVKNYDPIAIDMVNEPRVNHYFRDNGQPELVADAFKLAHEIAPDIPLFVNDYSILNGNGINQGSIDFYHNWIKEMHGKNVPLGGIGFQSHFSAGLTSPARVYEILDEFAVYDLPLHITEFDVESLDEQAQADYTRDFLTVVFSHPSTEAFIAWGFWEGDHWKPDGAMLRKDWSKKPAYHAWMDTLYKEFWTRKSTVTDATGSANIRGFYGDYKITTLVNGVSQTQNVSLTRDSTPIVIRR